MTTTSYRETAKIYEFPVRARKAIGAGRMKADPAVDLDPTQAVIIEAGGSWYHQAAILESEQTGKPQG